MTTVSHLSTSETLLSEDTIDGYADYKGHPIHRYNAGGWRSASFIIGVEVAERFVYFGISANLITYLTGPLGESTATAAENVNAWAGTAALLPLLGAFVADSFLGRFRTIVVASLIYILGLALLTLSALLTSLSNADCENNSSNKSCSPPEIQIIIFFFSLYLVAVGQGGHKPCLQAFGADQFDGNNSEESKAKSSFFNWWYFSLSMGIMVTLLVVVYIQDNLNWTLGFGVPLAVMVAALVIFLLGTKTYRYSIKRTEKNPFVRIGQVFIVAVKNWRITPLMVEKPTEDEARETLLLRQSSQQFKFLNKALLGTDDSVEDGKLCSVNDVEEAKAVLRLVPIWSICLIYGTVFAQSTTFFTKQGATMDREIFPDFNIPPATLQFFIGVPIIIFIPIYDRILVPIARAITQKPAGITMLQRIGIGILLSIISMVVAALVEVKRLDTAEKYGLVDEPNVTLPISIWWLVPQYVLFGLANVFTIVGLQEFFYDQVPKELKSIGISLYYSIMGVGSFLSSFIVSIIDKATGGGHGKGSWFADNINRAHLDYFYWLLAGLSTIELIVFLYFAKSYIYSSRNNV